MQPLSHQIGAPPCISNLKAAQACTTCRLPRSAPMPPGERQKQLSLALYVHKNELFPLQPVELVPQFNAIFLDKWYHSSRYRVVDTDGLPGIPLWPRRRCHCVL